ncbi:2,3-diketo-L-gulonate-binding periplasmic protein YiaO precursor [Aquimixticola soesokkakensis]|uniref:2,3-diketo-L-gulonate-binding periplasmic protein YiaO n=1 Tax=Aquimixticola soesokkakensis TaxID=1519096 RepID=A0A1Y5RQT1_9RHOB|nr:TRAP transporter substrate-binding protein [Aquimixticola soesokkakensis]SLN23171.1 2,3-diketo-L-gulonate-binding periplasmic protein YiaO precursor [Aquimixticola soesokkakensis]
MTKTLRTLILAGTALAALGSAADAKTLRLSHNNPPDHPLHIAMQLMADRAEELTDGDLKIRIYPNGQLGNQRESMELVQNCSLDMAKSNTSELEAFYPEYAAFNLPFLFESEEHFWSIINGDIGAEVLTGSVDNGFRGISYLTEGARSFYASKPINSPADLQGMKIRVQPSPSAIRMVELLGGNPTPIAWGELYSALQQGVVDGAENNPTALTTGRHGEVAKFFSLDEHTMVPSVVVISNCAWDGLSDDEKAALDTAAKESMSFQRDQWQGIVDETFAQAEADMGVTVVEVDKAPFIEAVAPMIEETAATSPEIADLISRIQAAAN